MDYDQNIIYTSFRIRNIQPCNSSRIISKRSKQKRREVVACLPFVQKGLRLLAERETQISCVAVAHHLEDQLHLCCIWIRECECETSFERALKGITSHIHTDFILISTRTRECAPMQRVRLACSTHANIFDIENRHSYAGTVNTRRCRCRHANARLVLRT